MRALLTNLFIFITLVFLGTNAMAYPTFKCELEKNHNPPISAEAENYFQQARQLEKAKGWEDWPKIIDLYEMMCPQFRGELF